MNTAARLEEKLDLAIQMLDEVRIDCGTTQTTLWAMGFGLAALIVAAIPAAVGLHALGG